MCHCAAAKACDPISAAFIHPCQKQATLHTSTHGWWPDACKKNRPVDAGVVDVKVCADVLLPGLAHLLHVCLVYGDGGTNAETRPDRSGCMGTERYFGALQHTVAEHDVLAEKLSVHLNDFSTTLTAISMHTMHIITSSTRDVKISCPAPAQSAHPTQLPLGRAV